MPRLWTETVNAHRREVRTAVLEGAAALVAERGLRSVTMSEIAHRTGIGRATLYKYFPDVEAILTAWHTNQIEMHLDALTRVRDATDDPGERLRAVLIAFAELSHASRRHQDVDLAAWLHREPGVAKAQSRLLAMFRELLDEAAQTGEVRDDVPTDELATYCLHALNAASTLTSRAAAHHFVQVTLDGVRRPDH